ncbi:MAG: hypothetical protein P4L41_01850 [Flavipsychrobacter sp.]|nr:hypothetical protein [Flavipsychrobacter sp.]
MKKMFLVTAIALTCGSLTSSAQIYVKVRPTHETVVRTEAPSPRHVWIDEDWRARHGHYEYSGGHWAVPPHDGMVWHAGSWRETPHGHQWRAGHWGR